MGAPYRGAAGVLGIGVPATSIASYATPITATNIFHVSGFGASTEASGHDRRNSASGYEEGLGITPTAGITRVSFSGDVCDTSFPILFALALGKDYLSNPGTTAYQHLCVPVTVAQELPQTSLYFKQTALADTTSVGSVAFHGCVLDTLTLTGSAQGVWTYSASFVTSGSGTTYATDLSSMLKPNVLPFRFGGTQAYLSGTTPTIVSSDPGTAATAVSSNTGWTLTSDFAPYLRSQTWTINNNVQAIYTASGTDATCVVRGTRVTTVDSTFLFEGTSGFTRTWPYTISGQTALTHGIITRCVSSSAAGTGYNYGFELQVPKAVALKTDVAKTLGAREITINHTVVNDSVTPALYTLYATGWNVYNTSYTP